LQNIKDKDWKGILGKKEYRKSKASPITFNGVG
jgi:hypothetical protein